MKQYLIEIVKIDSGWGYEISEADSLTNKVTRNITVGLCATYEDAQKSANYRVEVLNKYGQAAFDPNAGDIAGFQCLESPRDAYFNGEQQEYCYDCGWTAPAIKFDAHECPTPGRWHATHFVREEDFPEED